MKPRGVGQSGRIPISSITTRSTEAATSRPGRSRNSFHKRSARRSDHCARWREGTAGTTCARRPTPQAAPNQAYEATGKKHATFWRLTSPGSPTILRSVGRARGGSTLIEEGLGHGERLQTLPLTSPLVGEHISGERAKLSPPDDLTNRSNSREVRPNLALSVFCASDCVVTR